MSQRPKVLITGASGLLGRLAMRHLGDRYEFSGFSRNAMEGLPYTTGDITDRDAVRRAVEGVDMVLHLAAETGHLDDFQRQLTYTAGSAVALFQVAVEADVKRVVFMSSGSTMTGWEMDDTLPYGRIARGEWEGLEPWPVLDFNVAARPINAYACAKLFAENAARLITQRDPISILCIRSGAVLPSNRPEVIRHFQGWLDHSDSVQMMDLCLSAPADLRYGIFEAISENRYRWRDTSPAKEVLGWRPTGSADVFELPGSDLTSRSG